MAGTNSVAEKVKKLLSSLLHKEDEGGSENALKQMPKLASVANGKQTKVDKVKLHVNPRSREAFLQRMATFSTLTWFAKPKPLLPPCCARYGWENTDRDILRCTSCHAILYGKLPGVGDPEKYNENVKRVEINLIASHQKHCSWKLNPNPESFMRLEFSDRVESLESYLSRVETLETLGKKLPQIDSSFLDEFDKGHVFDLLRNLRQNHDDKTRSDLYENHLIAESACVIALCGWTKSSSTSAATVSCTFCHRQIGLWNFIPVDIQGENQGEVKDEESQGHIEDIKSEDEQPSNENGAENHEPAKKKLKILHTDKKQPFNPSAQHKPWCQWIYSEHTATDSPESTVQKGPGWQRLLLLLVPDVNPDAQRPVQRIIGNIKTTPPHQGLRNIRQMFKDWSSPPKYSP